MKMRQLIPWFSLDFSLSLGLGCCLWIWNMTINETLKKKKKRKKSSLELECEEHDGICTGILELLTPTEQQYPALEDLSMDGTQDNVLLSVHRMGPQY